MPLSAAPVHRNGLSRPGIDLRVGPEEASRVLTPFPLPESPSASIVDSVTLRFNSA